MDGKGHVGGNGKYTEFKSAVCKLRHLPLYIGSVCSVGSVRGHVVQTGLRPLYFVWWTSFFRLCHFRFGFVNFTSQTSLGTVHFGQHCHLPATFFCIYGHNLEQGQSVNPLNYLNFSSGTSVHAHKEMIDGCI